MPHPLLEQGRVLIETGEGVSSVDRPAFSEAFAVWRGAVESSVDAATRSELRRHLGPTGLFGGGGAEAFAASGGAGRWGARFDVQRDWMVPMGAVLAMLEVELLAQSTVWPLDLVKQALTAVKDTNPASLAPPLHLVFPGGRLQEVRPHRTAFVAGSVAVVSDVVGVGRDVESALHTFLEDLTAVAVDAPNVTELVFVLWCGDPAVASRFAKLETKLSYDGRTVRTHTLQLPPPNGR